MQQTKQMRKFYFAMVGVMDDIHWKRKGTNKSFHNIMKVAYTVCISEFTSTTILDYDGRYNYIEFVHMICAEHYGIYFDTDGYKYEHIPFTFIF